MKKYILKDRPKNMPIIRKTQKLTIKLYIVLKHELNGSIIGLILFFLIKLESPLTKLSELIVDSEKKFQIIIPNKKES